MSYRTKNPTLIALKPQNAKAITDAIFTLRSPTRHEIAERAQITEMTVCRAVTKLLDALFLEENAKSSRTSTLSVAYDLKFIIIDLTFDDYALYLLDANNKIIKKHTYTFVPSVDLEDNLAIFLERARAEVECDCTRFGSIGVIFNTCDSSFRQKALSAARQAFGISTPFALSVVDCLYTVRTSARNGQIPKSMYYLCLGHRNFAYYIDESCAIAGNPQLLIDNNKTISDKMNVCISPEILGEIIFSVLNAAAATLDAKLFIVESDRFVLGKGLTDSIVKRLQPSFKDARRLIISDSVPSFYIKGALIALQKQIMMDILTK